MDAYDESRHKGPYTKLQKQKRRDDVYAMYFEKGMSALKIASVLDINRNTINEDIKSLTLQIADKLGSKDIGVMLAKKIEMMEGQRYRLLESAESLNFEQRFRIEKFVFEIDCKITNLLSKITPVEQMPKPKITPLMFSSLIKSMCYSELIDNLKFAGIESIRCAIFTITGGDFSYLKEAEEMLRTQGLKLYRQHDNKAYSMSGSTESYDLLSYAVAKKVITEDESDAIAKDLF